MQVLIKLLNVWGSPSAIKHTSYEQHRYITAAIIACTARVKEALENRYKSGWLDLFKCTVYAFLRPSLLGISVTPNSVAFCLPSKNVFMM